MRARRNSRLAAGLYEHSRDKNGEQSERSFSPFSDSAVKMMPDGHLERLVVTPSLGHHDAWTESVQLLIKETADAFQAVHETMNDATLTSWLLDLPETQEVSSESEAPTDFVPPHTTVYHHNEQEQEITTNNPLPPPPPPPRKSINPTTDKPLPPCPEKPKMQGLKEELKKVSKYRVLRPTKSAKWAVSNGVAQLLSSAGLKRLQVDEMLTPERIEEMRVKRLRKDLERSSFEGRDSSESSRSVSSQQTAKSASKASNNESKEEKPSALPLDDAVIHTDFSLPGTSAQKSVPVQAQDKCEASNTGSLNPPPKNPQRYVFTKTKSRLPTIPEVVAQPEEPAGRPSEDHSLRSQDSGEFVNIPGPHLADARSTVGHDHIPCQAADDSANVDEEPEDDDIDYCDYQVAIQGMSSDLRTALHEEDENDMAEDMTAWFETFGFETHGELIPDGASSPWSLSSRSVISTSPSTISGDADGPMPVTSDDNYTFAGPMRFLRSQAPPKKWAPSEGSLKQYNLREAQGPPCRLRTTPPLVVGDGAAGYVSEKVAESALLGSSTKRDIGAYLRWKAAREV